MNKKTKTCLNQVAHLRNQNMLNFCFYEKNTPKPNVFF